MEVIYFTDGSVMNGNGHGAYFSCIFIDGYIQISNAKIFKSKCDNHYCEAKAIELALEDIKTLSIENTYCIYTDSDNAYYTIKQLVKALLGEGPFPKWYNKKRLDFHEICINISRKIIAMDQDGYDLQFDLMKSHVSAAKQIQFQKDKFGYEMSKSEASLLTFGNSIVDQLAYCADLVDPYLPIL